MTIDVFDVDTFKKVVNQFNAYSLGNVDGELCWLIPVGDKAGVLVRSSIDPYTKVSRSTGKDSIRVFPITCKKIDTLKGDVWIYNSQGSKDFKWTNREPGWGTRLQARIQQMSSMIERAGDCSVCGKPLPVLRVKKEGPNKGRWFAACQKEHKNFVWLDQDAE